MGAVSVFFLSVARHTSGAWPMTTATVAMTFMFESPSSDAPAGEVMPPISITSARTGVFSAENDSHTSPVTTWRWAR